MKTVTEIAVGKNTGYAVRVFDASHRYVLSRRIVHTDIFRRKIWGQDICLVYDADMNIHKIMSDYLSNIIVMRKAPATISKIEDRIKHLSNFIQIYPEVSIYSFGKQELSMFIDFLQGNHIENGTVRSNQTINHCLTTLREFFKFAGIDCPALNNKFCTSAQHTFRNERYESNLPSRISSAEPPMFISVAKLNDLLDVVSTSRNQYTTKVMAAKNLLDQRQRELCGKAALVLGSNSFIEMPEMLPEYDEQAEIIILLALLRGLRLGEILGITEEDISVKMNPEGELVKGVFLRNRISDSRDQYCKNLRHPSSRDEYSSRSYNSSRGTVFVPMSDYLYSKLDKFSRRELELYSLAYPENVKDLIADTVTGNTLKINRYVFIGRFGKRLTAQSWNNHLRELYIKSGIHVDSGIRSSNMTHRLRHSMAMILVHGGADILELQSALRHRSMDSSKVYYTPTDTEIADMFERFDTAVYGIMDKFDEFFTGAD